MDKNKYIFAKKNRMKLSLKLKQLLCFHSYYLDCTHIINLKTIWKDYRCRKCGKNIIIKKPYNGKI
jgi:hypothetical protein